VIAVRLPLAREARPPWGVWMPWGVDSVLRGDSGRHVNQDTEGAWGGVRSGREAWVCTPPGPAPLDGRPGPLEGCGPLFGRRVRRTVGRERENGRVQRGHVDPLAVVREVLATGTGSLLPVATLAQCQDYNGWTGRGGFPATVRVWSNRVFGVPVSCEVTKMTRRSFRGTLYYNGVTWEATLPYARIEEVQ